MVQSESQKGVDGCISTLREIQTRTHGERIAGPRCDLERHKLRGARGVGKLRKDSAFRVGQGYAGTIAKATLGAAQANLDNGSALQPTIQPTSKNAPASNEGLELAQSNENDAHIAMERYVISVDDSKGRARLAQLKFLDGDGHNVVHAITPKDLPMCAWAKVYQGRYDEEKTQS